MLNDLLVQIRQCRLCEAQLPLGPRPVLRASENARILVAAQAPGLRVHETGLPFNDKSGERLRDWMGISSEQFYDEDSIAIIPMGFCYPGRGRSGDLPPRPECASAWHDELMKHLCNIRFTLVIGQYAYKYHLPDRCGNLTENVKCWQQDWPRKLLLPHPSPRNNIWLKRNPWFEQALVPKLKARVREVLSES